MKPKKTPNRKPITITPFFSPRFSPHLIDLVQYEKDLLYEREHGIDLRPVPSIPGLMGGWTDSEMQAMRDNRAAASAIYERISKKTVES